MNKTCTVYYVDWQLQCCGAPFSVGDDIDWTAIEGAYKLLKHDVVIDYREEHHFGWNCEVKGHVEEIFAELSQSSSLGFQAYDKTDTRLLAVNYADGYTYPHGFTLWGYVVKLSNVFIKSISDGQ